MTNEELKQYRAGIFRDAANWKKPDRIPHVSFFVTWKIIDSEFKLTEALLDYDKMEKIVRGHQEKYSFDVLVDKGVRNAYRVACAMESPTYIVDDVEECVSVRDIHVAETTDVAEIAKDYNRFLWEKGMMTKCPWWGENTPIEKVENVYNEMMGYFGFAGKISSILDKEYGVPGVSAPNPYPAVSMENILGFLFGMKGTAILMRRDKAGLHAVIDQMSSLFFDKQLEALKAMLKGRNNAYCFDYLTAMLAHNFMNNNQFDEFYWPYLKQVIDVYEKNDCNMLFFTEGTILRYKDYFKDYKKGLITILPENDDVFELRKEIPNAAIMGGMPNALLGNGTKEQCIERAKMVIEELGSEGGFMLCQDKMGSYRTDGNPENLKAVSDFILNK